MSTNIVPLSPTARFLATQLSSKTFHPNILLPKHLIKPFLTSESEITYVNNISSLNSFERKHKFSASSTKYLDYLSKIGNDISSFSSNHTSTSQISIILPSSQLNPIFKSELIQFIPPPNSDIILLNPYFGQVEKYIESISDSLSLINPPRFWSIISTHQLTNAPNWGVKHQSIGEFKISSISSFTKNNNSDIDLIKNSNIIKKIFNTSTLIPQFQSNLQTNLLLVEQLIIEAALFPIIHLNKSKSKNILEDKGDNYNSIDLNFSKKSLIKNIINESIIILKNHQLFNISKNDNLLINAILSEDRIYKYILNLIETNQIRKFNNSNLTNEKIIIRKDPNDEENDIILPIRNESRANSFIFKLGLQYNISSPANKYVCDEFGNEYI